MLAAITVALVLPPPLPTAADPPYFCDGTSNTYTANSTFEANLNLLVLRLRTSASASPAGFANATVGTAPEQVYGLALCRGDTNASSCSACLAAASLGGRRGCPGYKDVTYFEDSCLLRFSGLRFLDFLRRDQWRISEINIVSRQGNGSVDDVPDAWFSAAVAKILNATVGHAVAAASARKYFATGEVDFAPKIYGLAQCVPELTPAQCHECFGILLSIMTTTRYSAGNLQWVKLLTQWCSLMYGVQPFYEGRAMLQLTAPPAPAAVGTPETGAGKKRSSVGLPAGIACSVLLMLVLSVVAVIRLNKRTKAEGADHQLKKMKRPHCTIFDLPTLQEATENFSEKNKLGEGGFGIVYKGVLPDGKEIAVKKLLGITGHGLQQLQNEMLLLAELQHKNLVRLQGFCLHGDGTLLAYEYIKNGNLDNILFDADRRNALNWEQQYNIILGIAKGILYLHEDSSMRIIHRDLKANNILLDEGMEPKIADFGLARLLGEGHTHTRTTRIVGTFGYMAPEYAISGSVSPKVDIFSFGVLVLEIVTRRRNNSSDHNAVNLLTDVWNCWTKGTISQILDKSLEGYSRSQALRCIHLGLLCVQSDPDDRPHISSVIFMLTKDSMELQPPAQPAFFFGRESILASPSDGQRRYIYDRSDPNLEDDISVNGVTVTEPYPR